MSYQVLARKWRPRVFADLVGQEHVVPALVNALDQDRLHHAYLFTGTRGVGKTTIARIFAKALNCEQGISSTPCGQCSACTEIDEGRFPDLIEVDAASRTKVEDTRDLLDNVPYAPARGRFKVYLIDEVHMFSNNSFNALLKTLEEPPPHVKFLLATTNPDKLPVTILSRCLQFQLKRISSDDIAAQLTKVLRAEQREAEDVAVQRLAKAADGSMRDGLSLLDQAIAFGGGQVTQASVSDMLGDLGDTHALELLRALASNDGAVLLERIQQIAEFSPDFHGLLQQQLSLLHRVALAQVVPEFVTDESVLELAQAMSPEDTQLCYQIGLMGQRDLPLAPEPQAGFEMVMLRMLAFRPQIGGSASVSRSQSKPAAATQPTASQMPVTPKPTTKSVTKPATPAANTVVGADSSWSEWIAAMKLGGMARQLASNCELKAHHGDVVELTLDEAHSQLRGSASEAGLAKALAQHLGRAIQLKIAVGGLAAATPARVEADDRARRQQVAQETIENDANVKALQDRFGAQIMPDLIEPIDQIDQ
ncbi:MAG TPA: DNA polymerase III subunit gamma/tau [Chromatiaceae bacterium]|nr:DNA polymerase III subunit gamma/tau [Chromatiaceae bacterium]HIO13967.1 DNA polymerase III subunit gamma/tau [Chromatiales bacterium]